jgi:hypothetical protein
MEVVSMARVNVSQDGMAGIAHLVCHAGLYFLRHAQTVVFSVYNYVSCAVNQSERTVLTMETVSVQLLDFVCFLNV